MLPNQDGTAGHLQLPAASRVLVRDGAVRQPVGAGVHARPVHARQRHATSSTGPTRRLPTTSASTRAPPSSSCSSTRPAGCRGLRASAATPRVVRGDGDLQPQPGPEHRHGEQRGLPRQGRARAGELRVRHEERHAARAAGAARLRRTASFTPNPATDLFMNSGDKLDARHPRRGGRPDVIVHDLTTGQTGLDDGQRRNGFAQITVRADAATSATRRRTRSARCTRPRASTRACPGRHTATTSPSRTRSGTSSTARPSPRRAASALSNNEGALDGDDAGCFSAAFSLLVQVGGCIATDNDFDGVSYQTVWPGTDPNRGQDKKYHPSSDHVHQPALQRDARTTAGSRSRPTCRGSRRPTSAASATGSRARTA